LKAYRASEKSGAFFIFLRNIFLDFFLFLQENTGQNGSDANFLLSEKLLFEEK